MRQAATCTVDLPRPGPATAAEYAAAIAAQVPALHGPVVVAHSVSCRLLPSIARRLGASHQVWLAGPVPDFAARRSFHEEFASDPTSVFQEEWIGADPFRDPVLAAYFLFHDARLDALQAALAAVEPFDLSAIQREVPEDDPRAVPSTYLLPTGDRTLRPEWMHRAARERLGVQPVEVDGSHNRFAGRPGVVADLLQDLTG